MPSTERIKVIALLTRPGSMAGVICLFILFYVETVELAGVKIAIIWKGLVVYGAMLLIFRKTMLSPALSVWGIVYAGVLLVNPSSLETAIVAISDSVKFLTIPVTVWVSVVMYSWPRGPENIQNGIIFLSVFAIISTIPFLTGMLQPMAAGYDLSTLGVNATGLTGIFANSHSASIVIAFATLTVLFFGLIGSVRWRVALPLVVLGCMSLVLTYARVGYLMLAASGFAMLLLARYRHKTAVVVAATAMVIGAVLVLFATSQVFRMRLMGENIYVRSEQAGVLSGREEFWAAAIHNFLRLDFVTQFYGMGSSKAMDAMQASVGLRIYAHNGFIDVLQFSGYMGALVFGMFFIYIVRMVFRGSGTKYGALMVALFIAYSAQMLFQGERVFLADMLFGLVLGLHGRASQLQQRSVHAGHPARSDV